MCVLYVTFGSKEKPRTFECVAMGFEVQITLIFCNVKSEQSTSCFVWI